jgi:hypothetical protein
VVREYHLYLGSLAATLRPSFSTLEEYRSMLKGLFADELCGEC